MKRIFTLCLIAVFLISLSGCVAKTKHDKLLAEKTAVERQFNILKAKEAELADEISARREEIAALRTELNQAKDELREARSKIRDLDRQISQLAPKQEGTELTPKAAGTELTPKEKSEE